MPEKQLHTLRERFQFLILVMMFFPVITAALFDESASKLDSNNQVLSWGLVIGIMILNYILLEFLGERLVQSVGKWIDILICINILSFVPVIYIISEYHNGPLVESVSWTLFFLLIPLTYISLIMFVLLTLHFLVTEAVALDEKIKRIFFH